MTTSISIPVNQHFNWEECLWYLDRGFDDCIYKVYPGKVRRAFDIDGEKMLIEIFYENSTLQIIWLLGQPSNIHFSYIRQFISEWFDLETELRPFYELLSLDPLLAHMPENYSGLRFIGMPDLFESLAWGIIGQQINLTFAYQVKRRLVENYGTKVTYENEPYWIFPSPEKINILTVPELRELQFSNKKAEYLTDVAGLFVNQTLSREKLANQPDFLSRQKLLTDIRGIGIWTANYVLMKTLKENAAIPYGDAGILNALIRHGVIDNKSDVKAIDAFYQKFKGWESYITFYLWRSLANKPAILPATAR
jgi:DNA-3-methyladenine glycosylase II